MTAPTEQGLPGLKSCPFCDGEAEMLQLTFGSLGLRYGAMCMKCGVWRDDRAKTIQEATTLWNTRPIPAPEPRGEAVREALEGVLRAAEDSRYSSEAIGIAIRNNLHHLRAALALPAAGGVETWRHRKRGSEYRILSDMAQVQAEEPLTDYELVVVYEGPGGMWVRRRSEFFDGRFEQVSPATEQKPAAREGE